jgi:hypothetical protein
VGERRVLTARAQPDRQLLAGHGPRDEEALTGGAAEREHAIPNLLGLYALGDDVEIKVTCELDGRADDSSSLAALELSYSGL